MDGWISCIVAVVSKARILPWLPGLLFGALAIGGSLLILLLPETLNRPLPQTIEDVENWSKKQPKADKSDTLQNEMPSIQDHDVMDGYAAPAYSSI